MIKTIIIDTNALMAISEFKLDLFTQIQLACDFQYKVSALSGTVEELHKIITLQRGKYRRAAKLALDLLAAKSVRIINSSGNVDNALVEFSMQGNLVLTQDSALKKRLSKPYLTIRQKKYIVIIV